MITSIQKWRSRHPRPFRFTVAILLAIVGGAIRIYLVQNTFDDYDEDEYIIAARDFREVFDSGDWSNLSQIERNAEHPPLVKMMYALALDEEELDQIPQNHFPGDRAEPPLPQKSLENARYQSAAFGVLTIFIIGWISPLAGIVLVFHSLFLHFTIVAYLEALPTFFSALAVLFYTRVTLPKVKEKSLPDQRQRSPLTYWMLSGACLGIAVAGKYPYGIVGVAVVLHALYSRHSIAHIVGWGLVSLVVFFIFNPYIWPDPLSRIESQLTYHQEYAENNTAPHSYFKPIGQLANPWHARHLSDELPLYPIQVFEIIVLALAIVGLGVLLEYRSVMGVWLLIGLLFLVVWETQWIQHKMIIMVPYSFAAAAGYQWLRQKIVMRRSRRAAA